jgi:carbamoyltransferase
LEKAQPKRDRSVHWLLSIHEDTNANATLFRDGVPVYAVAEERLCRVKYAGGFPSLSVQRCLDTFGLDISDIDVVLPANRHHFLPRMTRKMLPTKEHDYFGVVHKSYLYLQSAMARGGAVAWATERLSEMMLKRRFPQLAPFVDHHTAHAYSAYLTSGFSDCIAVTADNMGDGYSSKIFLCSNGLCDFQYGSTARHSPGQFYGEIAQLLGYHNLMAGKVTGLAAYGDPAAAYETVSKLFDLNEDETGFVTPDLLWRSKRRGPYKALSAFKPEDVAAATQKRLEDIMVRYVQRAAQELGLRDVVLAGGTFANVVVNQRILQLPEIDRIFIHPAMTDQGISMGAGLAHLAQAGMATNQRLKSVYLGPDLSEDSIEQALEEAKIPHERPANLARAVAEELAAKKVVARVSGRLEYGPRALGNRSILYRTDDPSVNDWLNAKLNRTEFMPFAPVTLASHAPACYPNMKGGELAARYMTITFEVSDAMKSRSAGVVHLDNTARPQVIHEEDNPEYHAIVQNFFELTGTPSLINTSFNMHKEPIVCSAQDAVRAFLASGIDRMALGPYLVRQAETPPVPGEENDR